MRNHKISVMMSPKLHQQLKEYGEKIGIKTRSRTILYILFQDAPDRIQDDYFYSSADSKLIILSLSENEMDRVTELKGMYNLPISELVRSLVYTHLKKQPSILS